MPIKSTDHVYVAAELEIQKPHPNINIEISSKTVWVGRKLPINVLGGNFLKSNIVEMISP